MGIDTVGMDLTGLSSNWKKLQVTLKKGSVSTSTSTSTSASKRKASDRDSGHATTKKRKALEKEQSNIRETHISRKRKRMDHGADNDSGPGILRRKSSVGVSAETPIESRRAKVNEGRSPTLVS